MDYKLVQKVNPQKRNEPAKWYAVPSTGEAESRRDVEMAASGKTTISAAEMTAAIDLYTEYALNRLKDGYAVSLGRLGTLRPTFHSSGAATVDEFKAQQMIDTPRIRFIPSKDCRSVFVNGISYTNIGVKDGEIDYASITAYKQAKAQETGSGTE